MPPLNTLQRSERKNRSSRFSEIRRSIRPDESGAWTEDTSPRYSTVREQQPRTNLAAGYLGLIDRYTPRKFTNPVVDTHKGLHVWCVYGGLVVR